MRPEEGILNALRARPISLQNITKLRGRPATSDRPPPRRCGLVAWAAADRPHFYNMVADIAMGFIVISHRFSSPARTETRGS